MHESSFRHGDLVPAVSVALLRGDRVLLVKRGRPPAFGVYAFPGGRVESGETLEQAARRELMEETGLQAGPLRPVAELAIEAEPGGTTPAFFLTVFAGVSLGGTPISGDDADEAAFHTIDEVRALPLAGSVGEIASALLGHAMPAPQ